ncbi:MAG TPA: amidohydrolase family protein [Sphingomicrobium sp.]
MAAGIPLRSICILLAALAAVPAPAQNLPLQPGRELKFTTDSGTWMSLDISPDGRSVITDILGDLYVLPVGGGSARRITSGMGFDSQPVYSPDGSHIAFVSDRSGAESLWTARADGSGARRISLGEEDIWVSPEWSPDGRSLFASRYLPSISANELWRFDADKPGPGTLIVPAKSGGESQSSLGAWPSPDGKSIVFARSSGRLGSDLPAWTIVRRDLASGDETVLVSAPASPRPDLILGSFFRPVLSPDGRLLVYGSRHEGQTGLRLLDLRSGTDRWLAFPVQHDQAQAAAWEDVLPRYDFTPDGKSILFTRGAHIERIEVASGAIRQVPFTANVDIALGPSLRSSFHEDTGPVRARLMQQPTPSPDGKKIAFSALGRIYVMPLAAGAKPLAISPPGQPAFMPSWSPDGRQIVYTSWTARDDGNLWIVPSSGGRARKVSSTAGYYTYPVFTRDGRALLAVRSSTQVRMHSYMEYGPQRRADLVMLPLGKGAERIVTGGSIGERPHFGPERDSAYLNFSDGLYRVKLDGSGKQRVLNVVGPGWYFSDQPGSADDIRISPDGKWALVVFNQQLHLVEVPADASKPIDLEQPSVRHRKITDVGADFAEWSSDGTSIDWALGSTFFTRPLSDVSLDPPGAVASGADSPAPNTGAVKAWTADVEVPRDVPKGTLLLRGATVLTMGSQGVLPDADLLIVDNKIAGVGPRGAITAPAGATVRDVSGRFIIPGLIDTHDHYADIRRGVLDFGSWGPRANLAYGVTTGFDPSTLSIDTFAYQDAVDAGLMVGSRMPSTGPAIFSFNRFRNIDEVRAVLHRYRDYYRTRNLKEYRTGNRRVRQWYIQAARELGMQPTTEGALSLKLDLTQIIDGYPGNEHALPAVPLGKDVLTLLERSRTSYTTTLQIGNGGPEGQDYFIARDQVSDDPKLNRFSPRFVVDVKTRQRTWRHLGEYFFPAVAAGAAEMQRNGGLVGIGSHGEMPGIGMHWEMEAHVMGGMTPLEALHAATMGSAETIGRQAEFGSIETGKFADLVILTKDPRQNIRNSLAIQQVMKNGRLYDGSTLDEVWPRQRRLPEPWYVHDVPSGGSVEEFPKPPDLDEPQKKERS